MTATVVFYSALVKKGVKEFFERGIVKDYVVPLVDSIAKDVINGNPPDLSKALLNVVEGRIFDKVKGGAKKLLGYLDDSKLIIIIVMIMKLLLFALPTRTTGF